MKTPEIPLGTPFYKRKVWMLIPSKSFLKLWAFRGKHLILPVTYFFPSPYFTYFQRERQMSETHTDTYAFRHAESFSEKDKKM